MICPRLDYGKEKGDSSSRNWRHFSSSTFDLNHRWVTLAPLTAAQMNGAPIMLQTVQGKLIRMNDFQNVKSCNLEN